MMGAWWSSSFPDLRLKVEALELKSSRFESHMEECERIRLLEAQLSEQRHLENKAHLDQQDKRIEIIQKDLVERSNGIQADLKKIIWGTIVAAGGIISFLALLISHLIKFAAP